MSEALVRKSDLETFSPDVLERLRNASPDERAAVKRLLKALGGGKKEDLFELQETFDEQIYDDVEPDIETYVYSPRYLGLPPGSLFPKVLALLKAIDADDIREAHLCVGKGGGKSAISSIMMARIASRLYKHYRDPSAYFRLLPGALIAVVNMSPTAEQAENVMFNKTWQLMEGSRCFKDDVGDPVYRKVKRHIELPKNVHILSGHSNYRAYFGYDTFGGVLDEFSWFVDTNKNSISQEVYQGIKASMETRFPNDHKLVGISSPRSKDDTLYAMVDNVIKNGQKVILAEVGDNYVDMETHVA